MSSRTPQRRAAKATKRKKLLAERQKAQGTAPSSSAAQARRGASGPIYRCLLQNAVFETGQGILLLVRGTPRDGFTLGSFLLDSYCLGVKDSVLQGGLLEREVETIIAGADGAAPLEAVEPGYARKLLHEAVAYARSIGIEPHPDYGVAEALFGDVVADAGNASFRFGCEGRPLYLPGPTETVAQIRRRVEALCKAVGEDGFDMQLPEDTEDSFVDDLPYDANTEPDPELWLDADEGERIEWVRIYHREFDDDPQIDMDENKDVHAVLHVGVENQLASNDPPAARRALERLLAAGLDRHEAIHAIANRLLMETISCTRGNRDFSSQAYETALDSLTVESWRAEGLREDDD
jgi:Domain of unknown function (DUF1841)